MISIIVPVYNIEEDLPHCIDSILNSVYTDFEVILVNDGSTDRSGEICNAYCKQDKRCKVIHQKNQGPAAARNAGLKAAQGEFISFIDGDDYIHPEMLNVLYEHIPDDVHSFSMAYWKKVFTSNFQTTKLDPSISIKHLSQEDLFKNLYGGNAEAQHQSTCNKLYHRELIAHTTFKQTATEDTYFNNLIYLKATQAVLIEKELYFYYQRNTSITHQRIHADYLERINSYYLCLNNIPHSLSGYRAFCLEKLYKVMINTRYQTSKSPLKQAALSSIKAIEQETFKEFITNKALSLYRRIGICFFYWFPFLYNCFMWICEKRALLNRK